MKCSGDAQRERGDRRRKKLLVHRKPGSLMTQGEMSYLSFLAEEAPEEKGGN